MKLEREADRDDVLKHFSKEEVEDIEIIERDNNIPPEKSLLAKEVDNE